MNDTTKKSAVEEITDEEIRAARRAYQAEWRRKNPEKVKAIQRRFYAKKIREHAMQTEGAANGE